MAEQNLFDNTRLLGAVSIIAYGLGMWWMENTWDAIQTERTAREVMSIAMGNTYVTQEAALAAGQGRQQQIDAIVARIDRNTDRIIAMERSYDGLKDQLSRVAADEAALHALVEAIMRGEVIISPRPEREPRERRPLQ